MKSAGILSKTLEKKIGRGMRIAGNAMKIINHFVKTVLLLNLHTLITI
jgi:hypothetical protein